MLIGQLCVALIRQILIRSRGEIELRLMIIIGIVQRKSRVRIIIAERIGRCAQRIIQITKITTASTCALQ